MNGCAGIVRAMATAAALLWSPHLLGQTPELPPTGARVRVVARGIAPGPVVAAVAGRHTDSLILDLEGGRRRAVPVTSITRLEISRGRKSKVVTGAAMGLILGTAATGAFLAMFCSDPDTLCESDEVLRALAIIATPPDGPGGAHRPRRSSGALGTVSGDVAGGSRHRWPTPDRRCRVALVTARGA